jgi:hypothetical protein
MNMTENRTKRFLGPVGFMAGVYGMETVQYRRGGKPMVLQPMGLFGGLSNVDQLLVEVKGEITLNTVSIAIHP